MELTRKEEILIERLRTIKKDNEMCVVSIKYTPIGEEGHVQTISHGTLLPITSIRLPLINLLKDIKRITSNGYTVLAVYDEILDSLNVYKMTSVKNDTTEITKIIPPIPRKKRKYIVDNKVIDK